MRRIKKLPKRDRSIRHAFIYINVLRTDLGIPFKEITKYLYDDNYRTKDGLPYTDRQVLKIWNMRKGKFRVYYINYHKYIPLPEEKEAKKALLKVPIIHNKPKHEILIESPVKLIEEAYRKALIEASEELNELLHLETPLDTNDPVPRLVKKLIKVIKNHNIHANKLTDKTLSIIGGLLYHPHFLKKINVQTDLVD